MSKEQSNTLEKDELPFFDESIGWISKEKKEQLENKKKFEKEQLQKRKELEERQKAKGLELYNGEWVKLGYVLKIKEKRLKRLEKEKEEKQRRIYELIGEGYNAVCKYCEYAYHRKSVESLKCPKCGSTDIFNVPK